MRQITRESDVGLRLADNLVKVWQKDGKAAWILIHVEIQARAEDDFGKRVFVYHYRIFDLYQRPVVSLAVLADDNPGWYVSDYRQKIWKCRTCFEFPAVKVLDYADQWEALETSSNPFAMVVMAHLRTRETKGDAPQRFRHKLSLSKALYRHGWTRQEIIDLYRFIDWIMALPEGMEKAYHQELVSFEKEVRMQYVTTAERIGVEKGFIEGLEKGMEKGLAAGRSAEKRETVRNLLALGVLDEAQIAQATGLCIEDVRQIKRHWSD